MIVDPDGRDGEQTRHTIVDPAPGERRALVRVLARAFRDNPMNVRIHGPDPARRVRANAAGLRSLVLDQVETTEARVITCDQAVVGGFVLARPGQNPLPGPSLRRRIECLCLQGGAAMAAWSRIGPALPDHRPHDAHWYVAVLGVDPDWQGRGMGGRLLAALGEIVAQDPRPVCLECDRPESVRFYRRDGFAVRAQGVVHGIRCWCLGRGFADESPVLCDSVRQASDATP